MVETWRNWDVHFEPSDEGGYTAFVPALPGCVSEGDTLDDARRNIREAIDLYLDPWQCPRCGGPYFGRDADTDVIHCHCGTDGRTLSESGAGKPCGWRSDKP